MKPRTSIQRTFGAFLGAVLALAASAFGQGITSSAISGFVTSKQGAPVAGATIVAAHEPTGTMANTTSRANGQYDLSGLRPGGPYTVTISAAGLQTDTRKDVYLELGGSFPLNVVLGTEVVRLAAFTVTGEQIGRAHV